MTTVQLIYMNREKNNARVKGQLYKTLVSRGPSATSTNSMNSYKLKFKPVFSYIKQQRKSAVGKYNNFELHYKRLTFTAFMDALFIRKEI